MFLAYGLFGHNPFANCENNAPSLLQLLDLPLLKTINVKAVRVKLQSQVTNARSNKELQLG